MGRSREKKLSSITGRKWSILLTVQLSSLLFGMTITLANVVLPQIRAAFLLDANPMDKIAVGTKIDSKRQPYSVEQVTLILTRAQAATDDIFLSLLVQAYSGCRVSEIVDCSTLDFNFVRNGDSEKVIPGEWFLFIGEDNREPGCTTNTHTARYEPLHPEIVKRLIPFMYKQVAEHGHGPLFRHLPKGNNANR